ncbi:MAG: DUF4426 domain-containing protein [Aquisalimonadaceae bacterium]
MPARFTALLLCLLLPSLLLAERMERFDDYEIHYNAMPTTRLLPQVAQAYNLQRSRVQGLVMVTVLQDGRPVSASVRGNAYTDSGQQRDINFREVRDGDAVYNLGTYRISDLETLRFDLTVRPEMGDRAHPLGFREQFFVD